MLQILIILNYLTLKSQCSLSWGSCECLFEFKKPSELLPTPPLFNQKAARLVVASRNYADFANEASFDIKVSCLVVLLHVVNVRYRHHKGSYKNGVSLFAVINK